MSDPDRAYAAIIANLEARGEHEVRQLHLTGGMPTGWNLTVAKWLGDKEKERQRIDQERHQRIERHQEQQASIALSTQKAAWIAVALAGAGAVITVLSWIFPIK